MPEYTQKQKQYIIEKDPSPTVNISFYREKALMIDMLILLKEEGQPIGINTVSAIHHEACRCLLHFGLDWRSASSDKNNIKLEMKLDKILTMIADGGKFIASDDVELVQDEKDMDDREGFYTEWQ